MDQAYAEHNSKPILTAGLLLTIISTLAGGKLTGLLDISWWLVFAPLWGPWAFMVGLLSIYAVSGFLVALLGGLFNKERRAKAQRDKIENQNKANVNRWVGAA